MNTAEINTYRKTKILSMNQKQLIVFMYGRVLALMEEAKEAIRDKNVPLTHEKLDMARKVFLHLLSTLDVEAGGEFAKKLSALYSYFIEKITVANVTKQIKELDDIIPLIIELKEAWNQMKIEGNLENSGRTNPIKVSQAISVEV